MSAASSSSLLSGKEESRGVPPSSSIYRPTPIKSESIPVRTLDDECNGSSNPRPTPQTLIPDKSGSSTKPILKEIYNPEMQDSDGRTPLMRACSAGDISRMQVLIDKGARVDQVDYDGFYAVHYSQSREATDLLLKSGAELQVAATDGTIPAHMFCQRDDIENLEICIINNIDLLTQDNLGNTLLHRACEGRSSKCVRLLLKNGLSPNIPNFRGRTPLHIAAERDNFDAIKCLIDYGADLAVIDDEGNGVLDLGSEKFKNDLVKHLQIRVGDVVGSPYGNCKIIGSRKEDNMLILVPLDWRLANEKPPKFYMPPSMLTAYNSNCGRLWMDRTDTHQKRHIVGDWDMITKSCVLM